MIKDDQVGNGVMSYNLIVMIMLSNNFFRGFSTLAQGKFYNNAFDWINDKWSLSATLQAPQLFLQGNIARISKQSSLNFSICSTVDKFKKGRLSQTYFLKMQDTIKLSLWKPTMSILSFISTNKIVSFQKQDNQMKNILVSFYDKNLSDELKRKEVVIPASQFQFFLDTIHAGVEDITNGNQQKPSYIHVLMKSFPPTARRF